MPLDYPIAERTLANGLRVAGSGAASEAWGPAMLKDPWHSLAGWITFLVTLAALWAIRRMLLRDARPAQPSYDQLAVA